MDWLEYHRSLVYLYQKNVKCLVDLGKTIVIEGIKREVYLCFTLAIKFSICMRKGFKIYVVEEINEDKNPSIALHLIIE